VILALETSCDETAAALVEQDGTIRSSVVSSQAELHARYTANWHDCASLVVYEALPRTLDDQLDALRYFQAKRAINAALDDVAEHLGNTRAVAKASYVDPRVLEHYVEGRTILAAVRRAGTISLTDEDVRTRLEGALLRLLRT